MSTVKIDIKFDRATKRRFAAFSKASPGRVNKSVLEFFDKGASFIAGNISKEFLSGQRLKRRTGNLARSVIGRGVTVNGIPAIRVGIFKGPALAYARLQEEGGTIKPKTAKALAIPQKPALTARGVERYGGPRNFPGTLRFIPFRNSGVAVGGLFEVKEGQGGLDLKTGKMFYLLVSQVTVPGQHYLRDGFQRWLPEVVEDLAQFLGQLLVDPENVGR